MVIVSKPKEPLDTFVCLIPSRPENATFRWKLKKPPIFITASRTTSPQLLLSLTWSVAAGMTVRNTSACWNLSDRVVLTLLWLNPWIDLGETPRRISPIR